MDDSYTKRLERDRDVLQEEVKRLSNELRSCREDFSAVRGKYTQLYERLEEKVAERTQQLQTVWKRLEHQYLELSLMLDAIPQIIYYLDSGGSIVRVNASFLKTFGLSLDDVIRVKPEDIPGCSENMHFFHPGETEERVIVSKRAWLRTEKGCRDVQFTRIPYHDTDGNFSGTFCVIADVAVPGAS